MRRFIYIFIFALAAASCTNTIELDLQLPEKRLILNSFLRTDDELQIIYLSERTDKDNDKSRQGIENVHGAEVTCYVNGEPVATAKEFIEPMNSSTTRDASPNMDAFGKAHYWFRAAFRPGDKVRIEAKKGKRTAYAEVVVPEPSKLEFIKSGSSQIQITDSYSIPVMDFDIRIEDVPGEDSYFRVADPERELDLVFHVHDEEGNKADDVPTKYQDTPELYIENDPILNDGYIQGGSEDLFGMLNPENTFRIFSDSQFRDKKGEFSIAIGTVSNNYNLFDLVERAESVDISPVMRIKIESLSFETYNYYKALNAGEAFGYEISFIMEPVIFPSNVTGGLGFVGVSSTTVLEIPLPTETLKQPTYTY